MKGRYLKRKDEGNRSARRKITDESKMKKTFAGRKTNRESPIFPRSRGSNSSLVSSTGSHDNLCASNNSLQTFTDCNENEDSINVVVRARPLSQKETKSHDPDIISFPGKGQLLLEGLNTISGRNGPKTKLFSFNVVFEPEATQEDVFSYCGLKKLIRMAVEGYNTTCFCYGQTGSGKTHTLTGPPKIFSKKKMNVNSSENGLVFRAFIDLFDLVKEKKDVHFIIKASFLEIYNEKVIDLLNPGNIKKSLLVRWSKKSRNFVVENLFTTDCEELQDLQNVLEEGMKNRSVGAHNMNKYSGRSHTILTVHITSEQQLADNKVFITKQGKINFVDLAGSEMIKKTNSSGKSLEEANNINKSLMVLGYCIASLSDPKKRSGHIPYRDSNLTKLLSDSLAGTGISLMIACVSPALSNVHETLSTLRYAARAKKIRTKPIVVMDPRESLIVSLKREVEALQNENEHLRSALDLSRKYAADMEKLSGSRESLIKTPAHIDLEKVSQMEGSELVELIKHYATENEALRRENADLFNSRDLLIRDHELVCRENEKLLRKRDNSSLNSGSSSAQCCRSDYASDHTDNNSDMDYSSISTSAESNDRRSSGRGQGKNADFARSLPDSIQKEINRKAIGKALTNLVETLKRRKSSGKFSAKESNRKQKNSGRLKPEVQEINDLTDEQITHHRDRHGSLNVEQAFGSPLSSASGNMTDSETTLLENSFDDRSKEYRAQSATENGSNNSGISNNRETLPTSINDEINKKPVEFPTIYQNLQATKNSYKNIFGSSVTPVAS